MNKYWGPIKWLGGIALIAVIIGVLFPAISSALIADEETRSSVLVQSIPFVAGFVAVLLTYILIIVLMAIRFNGRIPARTYRPIEVTIIAGIVGGVVALFNPLHFVGYKYGFVMLLGATLSFIIWSHLVPASAKQRLNVPPLTFVHHLVGAVAGLALVVFLVTSAVAVNAPQEPYGVRQRVWNSYDDARKAEIAAVATSDYTNIELPFLVIFNLLPGLLVYFGVREAAASLTAPQQKAAAPLVPARAHDSA